MPIKIQSDLPVKEILEKENIFVMDEKKSGSSGYSTGTDFNFKSDAFKGRYGVTAFTLFIQYAFTG